MIKTAALLAVPIPQYVAPAALYTADFLKGFQLTNLAPVTEVDARKDNFLIVPVKNRTAIANSRRASGSGSKELEFEYDNSSYSCQNYGLSNPIPYDHLKDYERAFNLIVSHMGNLGAAVMRDFEKTYVAALRAAVVAASRTSAVSVSWKTYASANPVSDVATAANAIFLATGATKEQLTVMIGADTFAQFAAIAAYRTSLGTQTTITGNVTAAQIAAFLGVKEVIVASWQYNSANEGQTASLTAGWASDDVLVFFNSPAAADLTFSGMARTFVLRNPESDVDESVVRETMAITQGTYGVPLWFRMWDEPKRHRLSVEANACLDVKTINTNAAYLLTGANA